MAATGFAAAATQHAGQPLATGVMVNHPADEGTPPHPIPFALPPKARPEPSSSVPAATGTPQVPPVAAADEGTPSHLIPPTPKTRPEPKKRKRNEGESATDSSHDNSADELTDSDTKQKLSDQKLMKREISEIVDNVETKIMHVITKYGQEFGAWSWLLNKTNSAALRYMQSGLKGPKRPKIGTARSVQYYRDILTATDADGKYTNKFMLENQKRALAHIELLKENQKMKLQLNQPFTKAVELASCEAAHTAAVTEKAEQLFRTWERRQPKKRDDTMAAAAAAAAEPASGVTTFVVSDK